MGGHPEALITPRQARTPIFKGGLGMYNGVLLHSHRNTIRFSDYGAGSNVAANRNLFLGRKRCVSRLSVAAPRASG